MFQNFFKHLIDLFTHKWDYNSQSGPGSNSNENMVPNFPDN